MTSQILPRRLRQLHIPEATPHFTPYTTPIQLQGTLIHAIEQARRAAYVETQPKMNGDEKRPEWLITFNPYIEPLPDPLLHPLTGIRSRRRRIKRWLETASPAPTVLSFTPRPTFVLPISPHESHPPDTLLRQPLSVVWQGSRRFQQLREIKGLNEDVVEPQVTKALTSSTKYLGPGQIHLWPVMDLRDKLQLGPRGENMRYNHGEYLRLLEDTTIAVLQRFGIEGLRRPQRPGIWVVSNLSRLQGPLPPRPVGALRNSITRIPEYDLRCIAEVHPSYNNDSTSYGVCINVSEPRLETILADHNSNPWVRLGGDTANTTTSIAAELAARPLPQETTKDERSDLSELIPELTAGSQDHQPPPKLDSHAIAVAWTHEFGRRLGMDVVDHAVSYTQSATEPAWEPRPVSEQDGQLPKKMGLKTQNQKDIYEPDNSDDILAQKFLCPSVDPHNPKLQRVVVWPVVINSLCQLLKRSSFGVSDRYDLRIPRFDEMESGVSDEHDTWPPTMDGTKSQILQQLKDRGEVGLFPMRNEETKLAWNLRRNAIRAEEAARVALLKEKRKSERQERIAKAKTAGQLGAMGRSEEITAEAQTASQFEAMRRSGQRLRGERRERSLAIRESLKKDPTGTSALGWRVRRVTYRDDLHRKSPAFTSTSDDQDDDMDRYQERGEQANRNMDRQTDVFVRLEASRKNVAQHSLARSLRGAVVQQKPKGPATF